MDWYFNALCLCRFVSVFVFMPGCYTSKLSKFWFWFWFFLLGLMPSLFQCRKKGEKGTRRANLFFFFLVNSNFLNLLFFPFYFSIIFRFVTQQGEKNTRYIHIIKEWRRGKKINFFFLNVDSFFPFLSSSSLALGCLLLCIIVNLIRTLTYKFGADFFFV